MESVDVAGGWLDCLWRLAARCYLYVHACFWSWTGRGAAVFLGTACCELSLPRLSLLSKLLRKMQRLHSPLLEPVVQDLDVVL